MTTSAGVAFITILPNMELFSAQLQAGVVAASTEASGAAAAASAEGVGASAAAAEAGVATKFGGLGLIAGVAFAGIFVKKSLDAYSTLQVAQNRLAVALKDVSPQVGSTYTQLIDWTKQFSDETGIAVDQVTTMTGRLVAQGASFLKAVGPQAPAYIEKVTTALQGMANATGRSANMFFRSLAPAILNAPEKAIPMLVKLNGLTQDQANAAMALIAQNNKVGATQLILNDLTSKYGKYVGITKTPMAALLNQLHDMEILVGRYVTPIVHGLELALSKIPVPIDAVIAGAIALMGVWVLLSKIWQSSAIVAIRTMIASLWTMLKTQIANTIAMFEFIAAEGIFTLATMEASVALDAFGAGAIALVAAAGAAGFALGTWINHVTGFSKKFVNIFLPNLQNVTGGIDDQTAALTTLRQQYLSGAIDSKQLGVAVDLLNQKYGTGIKATGLIALWTGKMDAATRAATDAYNRQVAAQERANGMLSKFSQVTGFALSDIDAVTAAVAKYGDGSQQAVDAQAKALADAQASWADWRSSTANSINFVLGDINTLTGRTHISAQQIEKNLSQQARAMKSFYQNLHTISKDSTAGAAALVQQLIAAGPAGQHMAEVIANATPKVRARIESDIGGSLKDAQKYSQSLESSLTNGFRQIAAAILVATGKAVNFADALNKIPSNVTTQVTTSYNSSHPHHQGRPPPPHPHRAAGGPVSPLQTYLVGENGPELFRPDVAGMITANHDSSQHQETMSGRPLQLVLHDGTTFNAYIEELVSGMAR